jgi:hypothetical protein
MASSTSSTMSTREISQGEMLANDLIASPIRGDQQTHSWTPPFVGGGVQQHPVQAPPELGSQQYPKLSVMLFVQQAPPGSNTPLSQHTPWASRRQGVHVGKVGPLNPRRAASVAAPGSATTATAPALMPSMRFSTSRRLYPAASERAMVSNRRSSMIHASTIEKLPCVVEMIA